MSLATTTPATSGVNDHSRRLDRRKLEPSGRASHGRRSLPCADQDSEARTAAGEGTLALDPITWDELRTYIKAWD